MIFVSVYEYKKNIYVSRHIIILPLGEIIVNRNNYNYSALRWIIFHTVCNGKIITKLTI